MPLLLYSCKVVYKTATLSKHQYYAYIYQSKQTLYFLIENILFPGRKQNVKSLGISESNTSEKKHHTFCYFVVVEENFV